MRYFVKKPKWLRPFYGDCVWEVNNSEKIMYLTFDDGPHDEETPFVLNELKNHQAKATFFCLGKHVEQHPELFTEIKEHGHSIGNHTYSHIDGWRTKNNDYYSDISLAGKWIDSNLFRPPFGHITWKQVNTLKNQHQLRTILWSVLSADFDEQTSPEKCLKHVINNAGCGSIVLFHDSSEASKNMRYALPRVLDHFGSKGYVFKAL